MSASTLTSKGQTTIPFDIRKGLGLNPGDRIEFHLLSNGSASMRVKRGTLNDFIGVLRQPGRTAMSLKAMDDGIARAMRAKHRGKRARGKSTVYDTAEHLFGADRSRALPRGASASIKRLIRARAAAKASR